MLWTGLLHNPVNTNRLKAYIERAWGLVAIKTEAQDVGCEIVGNPTDQLGKIGIFRLWDFGCFFVVPALGR
jgi:hypothetical protein